MNEERAYRGGSWGRASTGCRASDRRRRDPSYRDLGFRVLHRRKT